MKVDKSVCTCDIYFNGTQDSIIKFENVLTTLVENKILAIKRECHENDSKKKTRNLKGFLSRKHDVKHCSNQATTGENDDEKVFTIASKKKTTNEGEEGGEGSRSQKTFFFNRFKSKDKNINSIEKGNEIISTVGKLAKFEIQSDTVKSTDTGINIKQTTTLLDSKTIENDSATSNQLFSNREIKTHCDNSVVNEPLNGAYITQNSSFDNNNCCCSTLNNNAQLPMHMTKQRSSSVVHEEMNLVVTSDKSAQNQEEDMKAPDERNNSDLAICDDVSSQNTSDIEFSLVSDHASVVGISSRKKSFSAYSDHGLVSDRSTFISLPLTRKKQAVERKAISCSSTPLFSRHIRNLKMNENQNEPKKILKFENELVKDKEKDRAYSTNEFQKSQTIVIAKTNATSAKTATTTTTVAKTSPCFEEGFKSKSSRVVPLSSVTSDVQNENRVVLTEEEVQLNIVGEKLKKSSFDGSIQSPCEKRKTKSKNILIFRDYLHRTFI